MADGPRSDDYLRGLVHAINISTDVEEPEQAITLCVKGVIVTGTIIPEYQWFAEVGQMLGSSLEPALLEMSAELREDRDNLRKARDALAELPEEFRSAIDSTEMTAYIHLKEARIVSGSSFVHKDGTYWRGRLDEVSGWSVGVLRQSREVYDV